jgi:hypothetical protein
LISIISVYLSVICIGVNSTAEIGVAEDSAGGAIATSLARSIKGIDFQVWIQSNIFNFNEIYFHK